MGKTKQKDESPEGQESREVVRYADLTTGLYPTRYTPVFYLDSTHDIELIRLAANENRDQHLIKDLFPYRQFKTIGFDVKKK